MTVRILRSAAARDAHVVPSLPPTSESSRALFLPTARKIAAAEWSARLQAEHAIAEARANAERDGYAEGRARAHAEAIALLARARTEVEQIGARAVGVVEAAARAVSERALGRALAVDDAMLTAWAEQALASLAGSRRLTLRGARATLDRLASLLPPKEVVAFELQVADEVAEGVLHARSELGEVTLELATQVHELVAALHEVIASRVDVQAGAAAGAPIGARLG